MRGATLFSGIGAPEVSAPQIDWAWHAEIDKFPSAVMEARHGGPNLGDVSADDFIQRAEAQGPIDVLVAGSPCQSFSVAGRRLGLDDPRGNLALVTLGILERLKPRWFVFENVPGLLSSDKGRDFRIFQDTLEECGYSFAWRIFDAQYWGVSQRRRRVFVVGYLGDWRPPAAVLFERESLRGDPTPSRQAREETAGVARPSAASDSRWPAKTACTLNTKFGDKMGLEDQHINGDAPLFVPMLSSGQAREDREAASCIAFGAKNSASQGLSASDAITPTLSTTKVPAVAGSHLTVRRLTPRECERLQGFPDDFTAITYRNKPAADGPRYKALGNSMAVPVIGWILGRIYQLPAGAQS